MRVPIYALVAVSLVACAEQQYVYTPQTANAVASGMPVSRTEIPQEAPQGAVEITSYGIADVGQGDARVRALHVRMIVSNEGDPTPWRIDTRQQLVQIPGEGEASALYVNSDVPMTSAIVTLEARQRRVLDLYYPLPTTVQKAKQLPRFDVLWSVDTSARHVASRTTFDRVEAEPYIAYGYDAYWAGYGPYWWYDPLFPSLVFVHSHPIAIHDHHGPVHVGHFEGHFHGGGGQVAHGGGMHGGGVHGGGVHGGGGGMHGGGGHR